MSEFNFIRSARNILCVVIFSALVVEAVPTANAQTRTRWFDGHRRKTSTASRDNGSMMRLVRPLSESVEKSVVQVFSGPRVVALGTVVAADGYVITKRSELSGDPIYVRLPNGQKVAARVSAVRRPNDLALLKIEGGKEEERGIEPATFGNVAAPVGSFLISPGRSGYTVGFGVLGVQARRVRHDGRLGVRFSNNASGPALVDYVQPKSGAYQAGIQLRDQILKVNGKTMPGPQAAIDLLRGMYPGDVVRLTILRGENTLELVATMTDERLFEETNNDKKVNGPRNLRLSGFDQVIQHDTVLAPNQCGGPLLDTSGNVVGINIARAGRVVSYALPAPLVAAEIVGMLEEARQ